MLSFSLVYKNYSRICNPHHINECENLCSIPHTGKTTAKNESDPHFQMSHIFASIQKPAPRAPKTPIQKSPEPENRFSNINSIS